MAARKKSKSSSRPKTSKVRALPSKAYISPSFRPTINNQAIITILLLVLAYPIGVTLMFLWTRWPFWIKMVIAIPMTLFFIMILLPIAATLFILHKLNDDDSSRVLLKAPSAVVQTASPSAVMMTPTPGAMMKYTR